MVQIAKKDKDRGEQLNNMLERVGWEDGDKKSWRQACGMQDALVCRVPKKRTEAGGF